MRTVFDSSPRARGCAARDASVAAGDDAEGRRRFGVTCGRLLERRAQVPHISLHLESIADLAPILDPAVARPVVGLGVACSPKRPRPARVRLDGESAWRRLGTVWAQRIAAPEAGDERERDQVLHVRTFGLHCYKLATGGRAARDTDLHDAVRSGPKSGMHWNVTMGAANLLRGPTFDPVAQLVEQRTFNP